MRAFDAGPSGVNVADLVFDSLLDGERRAGTDPGRRSLRFGDQEGGADVTVVEGDETVTVQVRVLPPQRATIEVRSKLPTFMTDTDDVGRAGFEVRPGLLSLVIRPVRSPQHRPLQTAWVRV
jgi:hypothetical protein